MYEGLVWSINKNTHKSPFLLKVTSFEEFINLVRVTLIIIYERLYDLNSKLGFSHTNQNKS